MNNLGWTLITVIVLFLAAMYVAANVFWAGFAVLAFLSKWSFRVAIVAIPAVYLIHRVKKIP